MNIACGGFFSVPALPLALGYTSGMNFIPISFSYCLLRAALVYIDLQVKVFLN